MPGATVSCVGNLRHQKSKDRALCTGVFAIQQRASDRKSEITAIHVYTKKADGGESNKNVAL